ncbi:MAG TPA: helical backbone metal receptor [Candidatus Acidoferrales bacterium]|nr:helical backbone metal receptor [Candidatus Acidoferrales bacterium]
MSRARPGPSPDSRSSVFARGRAPAVGLLLALVLAGCGSAAAPASPLPVASRVGVASPASCASLRAPVEAASEPPTTSFPLTLRDDEGTSVSIPQAPARIVSLAPSITETLFALGEGSRIVGVTSSDDYPPAAKSLPQVASYTGVEVEKVVAARPDLVIAWKGITSASDIAQLRSLGYPVVVLYATTLPAVFADIVLVGDSTGAAAPAEALADRLSAQASAIVASVAGEPRPRVFYELDATKSIYTPAPDDFTTDLVCRAGGDPITSGVAGLYSISLERLVADDPQVIVLGDANYGTTPAIVAARPGWGGMTAIVDHAVRPVDDTVVTRPGPRIVEGLAALAEAIHPGVALPSLGPAVP